MHITRVPNSHYGRFSDEDLATINRLLAQLSSDPQVVTQGSIATLLRRNTALYICRDEHPPAFGGPIVGMASLAIVHLLSGRKGRVEDVVVDEAHRRKGIGRLLMRELIRQGHVERLRSIDLTSAPDRVAANAMYVELGFERRETNVYRLKL